MTYFDPYRNKTHTKGNKKFTKLYYLLIFVWNKYILKKRIVAMNSWISMSWGRIEHNNWGDDINLFFLKRVTKDCLLPRKAFAYPRSDIHFMGLDSCLNVSAIGSVLQVIDDPNTIVWGSGLITDKCLPIVSPKKILAVRGPLTRKVLMENGYDCPEVYGDPALLLPNYYLPPKKKQRYKLGIVPHYVDYDKLEMRKFIEDKDVLVVKMCGYHKWTDIIDQIISCDFVASSSLHGLIVAEAYNVPNLWVEIGEPLVGDVSRRFKFHDFFLSIGMDREMPFFIGEHTSIAEVLRQKDYYQKPTGLSLKPLIQSCPFQIVIDSSKK